MRLDSIWPARGGVHAHTEQEDVECDARNVRTASTGHSVNSRHDAKGSTWRRDFARMPKPWVERRRNFHVSWTASCDCPAANNIRRVVTTTS